MAEVFAVGRFAGESYVTILGHLALATGLAVFGLVVLFPAPKTKLTFLLTGAAFLASAIVFVNFFYVKLTGWPAVATAAFMWINAYSAFKHRRALRHSILRTSRPLVNYGRRSDD